MVDDGVRTVNHEYDGAQLTMLPLVNNTEVVVG